MRDCDFLWVEKYRPKTLEDCILPASIKEKMQAFMDKGAIPNLLLCGDAGVGKTTLARALTHDLGMDTIVINASKDGNIDTLRTTIQNFATTRSFSGAKKCVILDEADYLNAQSTQPALRNFIEEFSKKCSFIFTCNYPKRIIEPLHSRLTEINFNFSAKQRKELAGLFLARFEMILNEEGIEFEKAALAQHMIRYLPDWRRCLNALQGLTAGGELNASDIYSTTESLVDVANWIKDKKFTKCREWVTENSSLGFTHFMQVRKALEPMLVKQSIPDMFTILAEFDRGTAFATDIEVHFTACIVELMSVLEFKNE